MSKPIIYVDQSDVRGDAGELKTAMDELSRFVEENEPDILAFQVYFSEDARRMTVVHMHANAASLDFHFRVAGPHFSKVGPYIDLVSIDVYGEPSEWAVEQMRRKAESLGRGSVQLHGLQHGFARFASSSRRDGGG